MKTVWKFPFSTCIEMPQDAKVLTIDYQGEQLFMWALVDPNAETEQRFFLILPTGHIDIPDEIMMKHIKTVTLQGYVWHIFETNVDGRPFAPDAELEHFNEKH